MRRAQRRSPMREHRYRLATDRSYWIHQGKAPFLKEDR
jgi:hypothetical protein